MQVEVLSTMIASVTVLLAVLLLFITRGEAWVVGIFFLSLRSILFNFSFCTMNREKMSDGIKLHAEVSSVTFFAVTVLLPMLFLILLIRTGRWKDGKMNFSIIASSLTEKCVNNFRVVVHVLASKVVMARRSNVRKSPTRVTVGLMNVCIILI